MSISTTLMARLLHRLTAGIFSPNVAAFSTGSTCCGRKSKQQKEVKKPFISKRPQKKDKVPVELQLNTSENPAYKETPIVVVKTTQNNTLLYLYDHLSNPVTWTSAGIEGFQNSKRGTNYAGKVAAQSLAKRALEHGVKMVRVKLNGLGPGRHEAVKGLIESGLKIASFTDTTPTPHNGPKPRKARRL